MTTLDALKAARRLIAKGWTQRTSALSSEGLIVSATSARAVKWCALGAIGASVRSWRHRTAAMKALRKVRGRTQAEVVQAFTRAIRREQSRKTKKDRP